MEDRAEYKKPIDIEIASNLNIKEEEIRRQVQAVNKSLHKFFPDTISPSMENRDVKKIVARNSTLFGRIFRKERNTMGHILANTETHLLMDNLARYADFRKWQDTIRHEFGHLVFFKFTKRYRADLDKTPSELIHPDLKISEEGFAEWIKTIIDAGGNISLVNKDLAQRFFTPTDSHGNKTEGNTLLFESIKQGYYGDIPDFRPKDAALLNYVYQFYGRDAVIDSIKCYDLCFYTHNVKNKIFWVKNKIDPKTKRELETRYKDFQEMTQSQLGINLKELSEKARSWYQTGTTTGNWEIKIPSERPLAEAGRK